MLTFVLLFNIALIPSYKLITYHMVDNN